MSSKRELSQLKIEGKLSWTAPLKGRLTLIVGFWTMFFLVQSFYSQVGNGQVGKILLAEVVMSTQEAGPPRIEVLPFLSAELPGDASELRAEAQKLMADVASAFPENPDALEVKARFHFLVGESAIAKETWQSAIRLNPKYGYALHGLGKIALADTDLDSAVEYLKQAVATLPGVAEPVHDLSTAYLNRGDIDDAISVLRAYTKDHADSAETFLLLGQAQLVARQYEEAKQSFERTLQLRPELPRAQEGLGKALVRLGDRETARQLLEAQRQARKDSESTNRSAEDVFKDECRDYCVRYVFAARVYLEGGLTAQAEKVMEKATVLDSSNTDAWMLLLSHYQAQGDMENAIDSARRMCEENLENASCYFTAGVLEAKAGNTAEARKAFEEVIRLAPQSPSGYESLARLLIQTRSDLSKTPGLAQMVVQMRGSAADHELLAQCYAVTGKMQNAFDSLSRAIQLDPTNVAYQQAMQQLQRFRASLKK